MKNSRASKGHEFALRAQRSDAAVVARGTGSALVAGAMIITLGAIGMPVGLTMSGHDLPRDNVIRIWGITAILVCVLLAFALWHSARRLVVSEGMLILQTPLGSTSCPISSLTDVTEGSRISGNELPVATLVFWADGSRLFELTRRQWRRDELMAVVERLKEAQPGLNLSPEVREWLHS